jgi:hypothetical protein
MTKPTTTRNTTPPARKPSKPDIRPSENMSPIERNHWDLAVENNNTYRRFIREYGHKEIEQLSNPAPGKPSKNLFRGPEKDRYVLDPKDHSLLPIDMGHFFAAAQAPFGLGIELGTIVEIQQGLAGAGSAFQGEDFKANALGSIFGKYYLNNPAKGKTLKERLTNFFQDYQNDTLQLSAPLHERLYNTPSGQSGSNSGTLANGQGINAVTARSKSADNFDQQVGIPRSMSEQDNPESLARQQNKAIEELIALNFSVKPGEPKYNDIFRNVLTEIKKENPAIDIQAIANVAGISLQQQPTI